ncbi:S26 family signal peptidase [Ferruginibacter profundus]
MKKVLIGSGIFVGAVFVLWIVARMTGMLQYYVIPTPSNEPGIKVGEHIFVSNLKTPVAGKFIVFTSQYEDSLNATYMQDVKPGTHYLQRLCGMPGDVLEMKNAVLFVGGKNFDEELNLKNQYPVSTKELDTIIEDEDKAREDNYRSMFSNPDSVLIALDKNQVKKYQSKIKLHLYIESDTSNNIFKWLDKNSGWTADNFGPLTIPAGSYFVLGDNRHNALDSRYTGFIKQADIKGVVLNK